MNFRKFLRAPSEHLWTTASDNSNIVVEKTWNTDLFQNTSSKESNIAVENTILTKNFNNAFRSLHRIKTFIEASCTNNTEHPPRFLMMCPFFVDEPVKCVLFERSNQKCPWKSTNKIRPAVGLSQHLIYFTESVYRRCSLKKVFLKIRKIQRKTPVLK